MDRPKAPICADWSAIAGFSPQPNKFAMNTDRLPNIHPGEILRLEFLEPLDISPYQLSKDINVAQTRISEILAEKRSITADTALRLSRYFGNSAHFWLNLPTESQLHKYN
jgi:antitoxin HigA-1